MVAHTHVPLIINGEDILLPSRECQETIYAPASDRGIVYQGATEELATKAIESGAIAFTSWSKTEPTERRKLFLQAAELARQRSEEIKRTTQEEIGCDELWSQIITDDGIGLLEETAALITTALTGSIPVTRGEAYGFVFKQPLGVILGIAPWNAPFILGLRAAVAAVAAGNVVILKGSELSPRTHYLVASLFRDAGFPPGVVNFVLHRPADAAKIFNVMIKNPAVKKCNFTGSTQVGQIIASKAAEVLKPVLLELGGKNFVIVLDDADLDHAAKEIVTGAFLNNGQICMSTDLVIATESVYEDLKTKILALLNDIQGSSIVISSMSKMKLERLITDARAKGAAIHTATVSSSCSSLDFPPTVITGLTREMEFFTTESFGPVCGMYVIDNEEEIGSLISGFTYGLSSSIFTRNHYKALKLSATISSGAVHINSKTVHDEPTLPHGGWLNSGWGRFGSAWGLDEFLQTKTVTLAK